jgi:cytochrome c553
MKPTTILPLLLTLLVTHLFSTEKLIEEPIIEESNITIDENTTLEVNTDNCVGCHGLNFEKIAMGRSNIVNEMTKEYIEATLFNYKYNSVEGTMNPLMSWQTAQLSDDEIQAIAQQIGK